MEISSGNESSGEIYLTTNELARRWCCKPQTLRLMRIRGGGPEYFRRVETLNSQALYPLSGVVEYENKHKFKSIAHEHQVREEHRRARARAS